MRIGNIIMGSLLVYLLVIIWLPRQVYPANDGSFERAFGPFSLSIALDLVPFLASSAAASPVRLE